MSCPLISCFDFTELRAARTYIDVLEATSVGLAGQLAGALSTLWPFKSSTHAAHPAANGHCETTPARTPLTETRDHMYGVGQVILKVLTATRAGLHCYALSNCHYTTSSTATERSAPSCYIHKRTRVSTAQKLVPSSLIWRIANFLSVFLGLASYQVAHAAMTARSRLYAHLTMSTLAILVEEGAPAHFDAEPGLQVDLYRQVCSSCIGRLGLSDHLNSAKRRFLQNLTNRDRWHASCSTS